MTSNMAADHQSRILQDKSSLEFERYQKMLPMLNILARDAYGDGYFVDAAHLPHKNVFKAGFIVGTERRFTRLISESILSFESRLRVLSQRSLAGQDFLETKEDLWD